MRFGDLLIVLLLPLAVVIAGAGLAVLVSGTFL